MRPWEALEQIASLLGQHPAQHPAVVVPKSLKILQDLSIHDLGLLDTGLYSLRKVVQNIRQDKVDKQMAAN